MIEIASAAVRIEPDFTGFTPALTRGVTTSAEKTAAAATRLGGALSAAATVPVTAIGIGAVSAFASFDDALNQSIAIMGDAGDALRTELADGAREVARTTTVSAAEAAESYFFLASAGLDAESALAALPTVARFAQAGMFDMATATDLATDAQSALGLAVRDDAVKNLENLTRVTDVLVQGNILANATVEQFSRSLTNRAGAALRLLNKDIEEGVAVLAAFADQGVKGEEAGTRLDIVLRDLQTSALENRDAFRQYGITVFDAGGNVRNVADILEDLERAFAGASDETKRATLLQLGFSDRSVASLLNLVGLSDQIRIYEAELRSAGGVTQEVADRQLQSLSAQLTIARNRITDAGIQLGETLAPAVISAANGIATLVEAFTELPGPVRQAIVATAALAALAGPLLLIGGRLAQSILALRTLTGAQLAAAGSGRALAAAEAAAATGINAAGAAAARNAGVIGAAGGAAAGAGAGLLGGAAAGAAGGSLAAFGLQTTRGAIVRRGGLGGILARSRGFSGASVFRGLGITFATELGAGLVQGVETQAGTIGDQVKDTTANAVRFGGLGAAIGTAIAPGLGTAIGAGIGGITGAAIGFVRSSGEIDEVAEAAATELGDAFAAATEGLSTRQTNVVGGAIGTLVENAVQVGIEQGLGAQRAGAIGDALEAILVAGLRQGLDPDLLAAEIDQTVVEAVADGVGNPAQIAFAAARVAALGDGLGAAVGDAAARAAGGIDFAFGGAFATGTFPADLAAQRAADFATQIEDALGAAQPDLSFEAFFNEARAAGAGLVDAIRTGVEQSGEPFDFGAIVEDIVADVQGIPSIFSDVFGEARTVSVAAIEDLVTAQATKFEAFETNVRAIAEAGLFALADQIREAGPSAAAEAQAIATALTEGSDAPFRIEGKLRGIADESIEAFTGAFAEAAPEEKVTGFANLFVDTIGTILDPQSSERIGADFIDGLERGIISRFSALLARVRILAGGIESATRGRLEARSPSRVGMRIGEDFVAGINIGIDRSPVSTVGIDATGTTGPGGTGDSFNFTIVNPEPRPAPPDVVRALALSKTVGLLRKGPR